MGVTLVTVLAVLAVASRANAEYVYTKGNGMEYNVKDCERLKGIPRGTPEVINCMKNEGILEPWPKYIAGSITSNVARTDEVLCRGQRQICKSKRAYMTDLDEGCARMVDGCRSALRHLHDMMYTPNPDDQVCNNFALKSVRGFFHDYMSTNIEGSVLSENHLDMNVGLCRWTQYVNVLSDKTGCDAGSIIQMGGYLGYEACGFPLFEVDYDVKPYVQLNGGMMCSARTTGEARFPKKKSHALFDEQGQRLSKFADVTLSADSTATEDFWCSVNPHACATGNGKRNDGQSDGEVEYATDATAAAHVIGRVTCPVHGTNLKGEEPTINPGFFHWPRSAKTNGTGMKALRERVEEGYRHLKDTQCGSQAELGGASSDGKVPTGAIRPSTEKWPYIPEHETNLNTVGGSCGMPTQFKKTVNIGGKHRVARFMQIAADSRYRTQTNFSKVQCTDMGRTLYIPLEMLTITDIPLISSPALERFRAIAFDGVGTIDSAWDTCVVGCNINVSQNRICGGPGLQDFHWDPNYIGSETVAEESAASAGVYYLYFGAATISLIVVAAITIVALNTFKDTKIGTSFEPKKKLAIATIITLLLTLGIVCCFSHIYSVVELVGIFIGFMILELLVAFAVFYFVIQGNSLLSTISSVCKKSSKSPDSKKSSTETPVSIAAKFTETPVSIAVAAPQRVRVKLPAPAAPKTHDWVEVIDEASGHPYYYDSISGESVWEKPAGM